MIAVAKAYKERFPAGLPGRPGGVPGAAGGRTPIVHAHLSQLYDTLLEGNLARLIEPFSCVRDQPPCRAHQAAPGARPQQALPGVPACSQEASSGCAAGG